MLAFHVQRHGGEIKYDNAQNEAERRGWRSLHYTGVIEASFASNL